MAHTEAVPSVPQRAGVGIIVELLALMAGMGAFLWLSERVGSATWLGGAIGWGALMLGCAVVAWRARARGVRMAELGLARPRSIPRTLLLGLVGAIGLLVVVGLSQQLLITALELPAPDISRFTTLLATPGGLALALFSGWTSAAFAEEFIVRGWIMGRFASLMGSTRSAWLSSALLTSVAFGFMHFYQGWAGIVLTGLVGFLLALLYLAVRRNLWVVIIAHGLVDTVSFVAVYMAVRNQAGG